MSARVAKRFKLKQRPARFSKPSRSVDMNSQVCQFSTAIAEAIALFCVTSMFIYEKQSLKRLHSVIYNFFKLIMTTETPAHTISSFNMDESYQEMPLENNEVTTQTLEELEASNFVDSVTAENEANGMIDHIIPSTASDWYTIKLPTNLTLNELNELHAELIQHIDKRLQLSGNAVRRIDTGALQLLTSLLNDPNITVGWLDYSPELSRAAYWVGLHEILGLSH